MTPRPVRGRSDRARTLRAVRALRRFTVRAQLPAPLAAAAGTRHEPALELASADAGPVRRPRPRGVGAVGHDPVRLLGEISVGPLRRARRGRRGRRHGAGARRRPRRLPDRAALVPDRARGRLDAARGRRLLLDGVRRLRGAAQLLRRPRRARRRPPQGRVRPRRAADRRRPALPVGLLPPVAVAGRLAAGDTTRRSTRRACRCTCSATRTGSPCWSRWPCRAAACCSARVWRAAGRPRAAAAAGLRHRGERRRPARRSPTGSTAATRTTGSARRSSLGIGGVRAVRAFCAVTGHPAPEVFHTNEGHAGFLGLERIRELQDAEGLASTRRSPPSAPARCSPPTPRCRPASTASRSTWSATTSPTAGTDTALLPGVATERVLALGAEDDPSRFNMAHMGLRLAQRANGVLQAARRGVTRDVRRAVDAASTPSEVPIGSVTNGVHGHTWEAREVTELSGRRSPAGSPYAGARSRRTSRSGSCARALRGRLVGEVRRRVREAWLQRGASDARAGLDRVRLRPGRADHRLRPPRAHLQAADADAARPGPAARHAARPAPAGAARRRRQEPPGRRRRQGAHPADRALRRRPGGAAPHRLPARLRHVDGPLPVLGLRRVAEQPAAAAGGVRDVRA